MNGEKAALRRSKTHVERVVEWRMGRVTVDQLEVRFCKRAEEEETKKSFFAKSQSSLAPSRNIIVSTDIQLRLICSNSNSSSWLP
ncbi:unnamed protein product [Brassica oleracea]